MAEIEISIGGRTFDVACQEGEEKYLHAAAKQLDNEATVLTGQMGRLSEGRLLLMAGLMLADKTSGLQDKLQDVQDKLAAQEALIEELRASVQDGPAVSDSLAALVSKTEILADTLEQAAR